MLFETERLIARRITIGDVDAMFAVYGDLETVRYVGDSEPITLEDCLRWVEVTDRNFEKRGYGMVALCDRVSGEIVGFAGIVHPDQQPEPEVKYAFHRSQWGKGLATEAVAGIVRWVRDSFAVGEIIATVFPANHASQKVLSKAGFQHAEDQTNEDGTITQVWKSA